MARRVKKVKEEEVKEVVEIEEKMAEEVKVPEPELSPAEQWELSIEEKLTEYIKNFLKVSTECNMGTRYFRPVKEQFETHTEYEEGKASGAELRIVFTFTEDLNLDDMNFT